MNYPFPPLPRIGHGYDVHRLVPDRKLILGGVLVPYDKGLLGHSDADVLIHAIMDAILGALALGDIGQWFPDSDPATENIDSRVLARKVASLMEEHRYLIGNIDATIIAQAPRLASYLPLMRKNLACDFHLDPGQISIKATTEEHLGFTGEGAGIAAHAVCLLYPLQTAKSPL